jgi:urea transporter
LVGAPVLVAVGLIVGSVLGGMVAHSINVAIANAGYGPDDPVSRHHGDHRPW